MIDDRLHEMAGAYALGALDPADRAAFEQHLASCQSCTAEVRDLQAVTEGLSRSVPLVAPPADLRERVLRAATGRAPAQQAAPGRSSTRGNLLWLATAASLVLAVGLGVYVLQLRGRLDLLEQRLSDATARAAAAERQTAEYRRASLDVETATLILGAPDLVRTDLAGVAPASIAKGRAFWSRSRGLVFTAAGLPQLEPGKSYQLWIVGPQAPVSAAVFSPDPSGRATAIVDAAAAQTTPSAFAVTIEPAGGMPQPTGDKVLIGAASE